MHAISVVFVPELSEYLVPFQRYQTSNFGIQDIDISRNVVQTSDCRVNIVLRALDSYTLYYDVTYIFVVLNTARLSIYM